jgi:putative PEP-CTERM system histidine kinase
MPGRYGASGYGLWAAVADLTHLAGACATLTMAAVLWGQRERYYGAGRAIVAGLAVSGVWCLSVAVDGENSAVAQGVMALRNLAYLWAVYRMFASDGRHTSMAPVGPVVAALALVDLLAPAAHLLEASLTPGAPQQVALYRLNMLLALLGVVGALVLVHNLYASASSQARTILRWPAVALGLVWAFELNLYTVAYLAKQWPVQLAAMHGLLDMAFAGIMGVGALRGGHGLRLQPSRAVAFRTISLLLIGGYLAAMVAVAQWLAMAGGDYARWLHFGFLIAAVCCAALTLPSRRMRAWLRVVLTKHLFQHRYDYRAEWLRFTRTIGMAGPDAPPLEERAIQALADITDSPAGLLITPDDTGEMVLAARWHWHSADVPALAFSRIEAAFLERHDYIVDLDALRGVGDALRGGAVGDANALPSGAIPAWLAGETQAWAVVPLVHGGRMMGAVVLARPPHTRRLDWEDFDLLRVVGQQIATYLAEHAGQQALAEANRFDDFHRRIAFVMHDIKNLASQFALLARNAERHAENPEFRADMLVTLRNSADKLGALVTRLSRYGGAGSERCEAVPIGQTARDVAHRFTDWHNVTVLEREPCVVAGDPHGVEQVLLHLVQNAVDASEPTSPVFVSISRDGASCRIEIVDAGTGMAPDFLRNRLFRPFDSTKPAGFGIGAYEAREMVRAMQGRLDVESREGLGTRFIIRLPLHEAVERDGQQDNGPRQVA